MIPEKRLSASVIPADYYEPDNVDPPSPLVDYELGGIALSDPSAGLKARLWTGYADGKTGNVYLYTQGVFDTLIFSAPGITEFSFTFDQNMRPFIAYVQDGRAKYRWYDTVLGENRITELDPLDYSPRCCLDDKRPWQTAQGANDVILAYMRGDSLYFRQQRDRYEVEYLLKSGLSARLLRVGMNKGYRLQFLLEETA